MQDKIIAPSGEVPVRVTGVPTDATDHPALRKIARAVISIAERRLAEGTETNVSSHEDGDE